MKFFLFLLIFFSSLFGAKAVEVGKRFESSENCKVCHRRIVEEWSNSWHAKSHFEKDEYFKKSLEYVSRKTRKSLNAVKIQCATCHNPRISVTKTDEDYEIAAVMGLTDEDDPVNRAVNSKVISEGINCVVCHNIDKIHDEYDKSRRGINRVEWTPSGVMTGPFKDAKSPYHKIVSHEFMRSNPNKLCFVCHANDRSVKGVVFTDMESEYVGKQTCVSCHMGPKQKGVAATYRMYNGKAKMRMVRNHGFRGAHTAALWKDALRLELKKQKNRLLIKIKNPQPHNIPSGFGSREILVEVVYKKANATVGQKTISLTRHYIRKHKKVGIAHLARKQSKDTSIKAHGEKTIRLPMVTGAESVEVTLYYRLVNDEVRSLLDLKEPIWSKKNFIAKSSLRL
ncbi:cytochrome c family protein [Sulfurimonas sp. SWIR-19]|uniref:cytochrome c family protein n=1 Tax=Sulfurimonas sp. SWIR-19 TaxID=2878390 RepID=UPI001CF4E3DB|nr:cytochrome c family protein [Sulfurimonas sp. SWIR-19]UCN00688.1 cytochrome c family protein [Sulfurimonas sp. SWIR-19]